MRSTGEEGALLVPLSVVSGVGYGTYPASLLATVPDPTPDTTPEAVICNIGTTS